MEDQAEKFREQKKHDSLLLIAAARGYLDDMKALLERGAVLDARDKGGLGPLHFAAGRGRRDIVQLLWSNGVNLDEESLDGKTPLHLAAAGGHVSIVSFLLQKGAWAEAEDAREDTPLHEAAKHGHAAVLDALLRHGSKAECTNKVGLTPAGEALLHGHLQAVQQLLGWGAALKERPRGYSLLHLAAGLGRSEAVGWLLGRGGVDANEAHNPDQATPLHSAALGGDPACIELLLQAGADSCASNAAGSLPEHCLPQTDSAQVTKARELLQAAASKRPVHARNTRVAGGATAAAQARELSAQEAFIALTPEERVSKAGRWVGLSPDDLEAALRGYSAEARQESAARLALAQQARARCNVHKVLAALRADEDFQADAAVPAVCAAVDALRRDPGQYERYARDARIASVLAKMRRAHAVAQTNGQRTVALEDMIIPPSTIPHRAAADAALLQTIETDFAAHVAAAAAAAAATQPGAARRDAEAAFAAARAASSVSLPGRKKTDDPNIPEWMKGEFSWAKVWREFASQAVSSLLILAVVLVLSVAVRRRLPWDTGPVGSDAAGQSAGVDVSQQALERGEL